MRRLVDESCLESSEDRLADLFRSAARFELDPFRKRRVFVRLSRMQPPRAQPGHPTRFGMRLQIVATLLVSGTAGAALGRHYVAKQPRYLGLEAPAPSAAQQPDPAPRPHLMHRSEVAIPSSEVQQTDGALINEPANEAPTDLARSTPKNETRARSDASEEVRPVVEAIQALRTERDPSRAQALLNEYLKAHPRGVLSEDAHALAIEAAFAQRDPRAADYARRYLTQFPHGRYGALAKRAIAQQD